MACHKSAQKCIRKTVKQTLVNKNRVSHIRTEVKKVERLLSSSKVEDKKILETALVEAERQLMRGVSRGMIHKNTAARKVSRLVKRFKAIQAA
jgi:small subunit ribosomal protein S20